MSKTAGTAVTLGEAIERHGPDALRYFLLREVGFEADGNFSWERFDERYTADLADGLGNLVSRSLAMIAKYREGIVPPATATTPRSTRPGRRRSQRVRRARWMRYDLRGGAEAAWDLVATANLYIQQVGAVEAGEGGTRRRAGRRAGGAGARALPARRAGGPVHPGKGREYLGGAGCIRPSRRTRSGARSRTPPTGGLTTQRPEVLFPKPASV